jgi:hypothetical protein
MTCEICTCDQDPMRICKIARERLEKRKKEKEKK